MAANMGIRAIATTNQRIGWNDNFTVTIDMTIKMTANAVTIFDFRGDRLNARIDTSPLYAPNRGHQSSTGSSREMKFSTSSIVTVAATKYALRFLPCPKGCSCNLNRRPGDEENCISVQSPYCLESLVLSNLPRHCRPWKVEVAENPVFQSVGPG
jgi:hypothetical protein